MLFVAHRYRKQRVPRQIGPTTTNGLSAKNWSPTRMCFVFWGFVHRSATLSTTMLERLLSSLRFKRTKDFDYFLITVRGSMCHSYIRPSRGQAAMIFTSNFLSRYFSVETWGFDYWCLLTHTAGPCTVLQGRIWVRWLTLIEEYLSKIKLPVSIPFNYRYR